MTNTAQTLKAINDKIHALSQREIQNVADRTARWNQAAPILADLMKCLSASDLAADVPNILFITPTVRIIVKEESAKADAQDVVMQWAQSHQFDLRPWTLANVINGALATDAIFDREAALLDGRISIYIVQEEEANGHGI